MSKIAIIVPYFGKLPSCFECWWTSALYNSNIEFWMFTDNSFLKSEKNIKVEHISFENFKTYIQSIFDFEINLDKPYKLCDYKPVYGLVFKDRLKDYDYWGYCDVDLIFGDIGSFITEKILKSHDKIFVEAHISIFKNNYFMNSLFMNQGEYPEYNFKEAYSTSEACYYDEFRGMELKCIRNRVNVYNDTSVYINVNPQKAFFELNGKKFIAVWENGKLYAEFEDGQRKELMYIHICKRKMEYLDNNFSKEKNNERMLIVPGKVIADKEYIYTKDDLFRYKSGNKLYSFQWKINRFKLQLKMYSVRKILERNKRAKQIKNLKENLLKTHKHKVLDPIKVKSEFISK